MRKYITLFFLLACSAASAETIAENLLLLNQTKTDIGTAITAKGQSVTGLPFTRYDEAIASITTGGGTTDPDVFPAGLAEDAASTTDNISAILDTNDKGIFSTCYCGNGVCLAGEWANLPGTLNIYRSTNYGCTWASAYATSTLLLTYGFAYCGSGTVIAAVGTSQGAGTVPGLILKSTDYGDHWTQKTVNSTGTYQNGVTYLGSDTVLVSVYGQGEIHRSTDNGENWSKIITLNQPSAGTLLSLGNGTALCGTYGTSEKLYKSEDYGVNWAEITTTFNASGIHTLEYCGGGRVLAGTNPNGRIYKSDDYGDTWSLASDTLEETIYTICYAENDIVYAGTEASGYVYKSVDNGDTWLPYAIYDSAGTTIRGMTYIGDNTAIFGTSGNVGYTDGSIGMIRSGMLEKDRWK